MANGFRCPPHLTQVIQSCVVFEMCMSWMKQSWLSFAALFLRVPVFRTPTLVYLLVQRVRSL